MQPIYDKIYFFEIFGYFLFTLIVLSLFCYRLWLYILLIEYLCCYTAIATSIL